MTRVGLLLLAALLASSLVAVNNAYEARRVFSELDRARQVQAQLDAEYKRLDAERQAQGTHLLVEKAAREKLKMRTASPAVTTYVFDPAASGVAR
jgi:cell division protein FtsL